MLNFVGKKDEAVGVGAEAGIVGAGTSHNGEAVLSAEIRGAIDGGASRGVGVEGGGGEGGASNDAVGG